MAQCKWAQTAKMWGRKNRKKEKWAAKDPMDLYFLEGSRRTMVTNNKNPEQMNYLTRSIRKSVTSVGIAHQVIQHSISSWFQKEAVTQMGLIRIIYCHFIFAYLLFSRSWSWVF
jgi:hypothetical protein